MWDSTWYEGLIKHLSERELTDEERKLVDHILSSDISTLRHERIKEMLQKKKDTKNDQPFTLSTQKYPALITISGIFVVFAWIVGLASLVAAFYYFFKGEEAIVLAVAMLVCGAITVLTLAAASELIKLFIDIEHNTRMAAKND